MATALHIQHLNKHFSDGKQVLRDINLRVQSGEMVALIGASGSGKSTLLRHIAGLVSADAGSESLIEIQGHRLQQGGRLSRQVRALRSQIGFVFQQFNLVARLPVLVNVMVGHLPRMPWWRACFRLFNTHERNVALEALQRVGIAQCALQRASTLSGGQQQRAAIARTLVQQARLVLADEPIASLDPESSRKVMEILARINREDGCTIMVSLHQVDIAIKYCPRVIALHQGHILYDGPAAALTPELLRRLYGVQASELLPTQAGSTAAEEKTPPERAPQLDLTAPQMA
ncbi:phosphonate ABC transporter ATP-binding protein [Neisseriaceae bacterium TC5R-5]|nr:phosphonate ABC transporter ATP-binding protein [Neisseriaceae bacterium TC5R-5]